MQAQSMVEAWRFHNGDFLSKPLPSAGSPGPTKKRKLPPVEAAEPSAPTMRIYYTSTGRAYTFDKASDQTIWLDDVERDMTGNTSGS
mmetsp:Transcript_42385/g.99289  ORF Transcript_42385/g.99289 Transcript_42385/m.99289 type:complete len:87 (+) Transcript_42385:142-402(+)